MMKLTPVLAVERIEPVLDFWVDRLGFVVTTKVPTEDGLGFVLLSNGAVEVMYQTQASIADDVPEFARTPLAGSLLFIQVDDLDAIDDALGDTERVVPRRKTFYGSEEIIVRDPAGNGVTFAMFPAAD